MQDVARSIRDLLLEFGGCWITPDFSIRGEVTQVLQQQREFRRIVSFNPLSLSTGCIFTTRTQSPKELSSGFPPYLYHKQLDLSARPFRHGYMQAWLYAGGPVASW
ncbi:MAG: hypothetical protein ACM3PY_16065 [Omnitrophica WOR_2 bacterium]